MFWKSIFEYQLLRDLDLIGLNYVFDLPPMKSECLQKTSFRHDLILIRLTSMSSRKTQSSMSFSRPDERLFGLFARGAIKQDLNLILARLFTWDLSRRVSALLRLRDIKKARFSSVINCLLSKSYLLKKFLIYFDLHSFRQFISLTIFFLCETASESVIY